MSRQLRALSRLVVVAVAATACLRAAPLAPGFLDVAPRSLPDEQLAAVDGDALGGIVVGLRGRPVVLNVWASWCGPCRVEAPLLQRAATAYGDDVVFLGLASRDRLPAAREFMRRYGISYPNVIDADGSASRALRAFALPTTLVFGADGTLQATVVGGISEQALAGHVEQALR